jgi:hypothetical protein
MLMSYLNYVKVFTITILNLTMIGFIFSISFMFCSVYKDWAHNLLIVWLLCFIFDFILFEIINECFILVLYAFKNKHKFIKYAMRTLISLKNLRNFTI